MDFILPAKIAMLVVNVGLAAYLLKKANKVKNQAKFIFATGLILSSLSIFAGVLSHFITHPTLNILWKMTGVPLSLSVLFIAISFAVPSKKHALFPMYLITVLVVILGQALVPISAVFTFFYITVSMLSIILLSWIYYQTHNKKMLIFTIGMIMLSASGFVQNQIDSATGLFGMALALLVVGSAFL